MRTIGMAVVLAVTGALLAGAARAGDLSALEALQVEAGNRPGGANVQAARDDSAAPPAPVAAPVPVAATAAATDPATPSTSTSESASPNPAAATGAGMTSPLRPVDSLNLDRFSGTWYVVATIPDRFFANCSRNATSTYVMQADQRLQVENRCQVQDGSTQMEQGIAQLQAPGESPSKLRQRFAPDWLAWLPLAWSNVWIIELDPAYHHAVAATPDRQHLWLLSRSPTLDQGSYDRLLGDLKARGFDMTQLRRIPQEGDSATSAEEGVNPSTGAP